MAVQVKLMESLKSRFTQILNDELAKEARVLMSRMEKEIILHLSRTLVYAMPRNGRENRGFSNAKIVFSKRNILYTNHGVKVEIHAFIADGSNRPHKIWHIINGGRETFVAKKHLKFPKRKSNRTLPNNLDARPFDGYTGEWVTVKKGSSVSGIVARDFYATAMKEIIKTIKVEFAPYTIKSDYKN